MLEASYHLKVVLILTFGFGAAGILGYLSQVARLSPIPGYLIAGYMIGPHCPGFVADREISEQLAEIGVILMMFGVGLHFKWQDLLNVKAIALPGAIGQVLFTAVVGSLLIYSLGWPFEVGLITGLAVGIASTVVLVRVLSDQGLLNTPRGNIAMGWLIVEDILTVAMLMLMPVLADLSKGSQFSFQQLGAELTLIIAKFTALVALMLTLGRDLVAKILLRVAQTRSHELFTLSMLALIFIIATVAALAFGASIALGAFIAGIVVGQTEVRHQAFADSMPLKDVFVVIFFLSIGMLFNPRAIFSNPSLFTLVMALIVIIKPLVAFGLTILLRYPLKTALTIALALAQIGEFSFILAQEAMNRHLLPQEMYDVIIACSLVSISINPLLFQGLNKISAYLDRFYSCNESSGRFKKPASQKPIAIVVGFGPIGQSVSYCLCKKGYEPLVIDHNIDTIAELRREGWAAVYGDAAMPNILKNTPITRAKFLIITVPDADQSFNIIQAAKQLNPSIVIMARARYTTDQPDLERMGVKTICCESESIKAFDRALGALTA